jgi:capsular polysaccharide biosynthesis protein
MRSGGQLPVLAGAAVGVVAAVALTLAQSAVYRAEASIVLVAQGKPPGDDPALAQAAAAAEDLFHSRAVAEPAIVNLKLDASAEELLDRVTVDATASSSLVRISVEGPSRAEARRTAQELTELSTVLFNDRFRPGTTAAVWEPARVQDDPVSQEPARNAAFGALFGALAGWVVLLASGRRPQPEAPRLRLPRPQGQRRARAPALAPVEQPSAPEPAAVREPLEPPPPPATAPESGPAEYPEAGGDWTTGGVERLLREFGGEYPERADELRLYADSFREVAEPDGTLPPGITVVVEDVFADLIRRARLRGRVAP